MKFTLSAGRGEIAADARHRGWSRRSGSAGARCDAVVVDARSGWSTTATTSSSPANRVQPGCRPARGAPSSAPPRRRWRPTRPAGLAECRGHRAAGSTCSRAASSASIPTGARPGVAVRPGVDLIAEHCAGGLEFGEVAVLVKQVGLGGDQVGLGDAHRGLRAALALRIRGPRTCGWSSRSGVPRPRRRGGASGPGLDGHGRRSARRSVAPRGDGAWCPPAAREGRVRSQRRRWLAAAAHPLGTD
jgi:hypothetical protein